MLVVPSPKSHDQVEGEPVDLSLNEIVNGKTPEVLSGVNAAFSGAVDVNPVEKNIPLP